MIDCSLSLVYNYKLDSCIFIYLDTLRTHEGVKKVIKYFHGHATKVTLFASIYYPVFKGGEAREEEP